MSLREGSTIDDLLGDSLIQAVMKADHVEPQALRSLLTSAAGRFGAGRRQRALTVFVGSAIDRRKTPRGADASPAAGRKARVSGEDGSARCC
jgi:hypothetical protein